MYKILTINSFGESGCVADIIKAVTVESAKCDFETTVAYARGNEPTYAKSYRIGSKLDVYSHALRSRALDEQGLGSREATLSLVKFAESYSPDIVHLHQLHGSYLNYPVLFDWLSSTGRKIVWTLHDTWPFTGDCAYYDHIQCRKWKDRCHDCSQVRAYPSSWIFDRSSENFDRKKKAFNSIDANNMTIVTPSSWLSTEVSESFLSKFNRRVINNGISFAEGFNKRTHSDKDFDKVSLLAVAGKWHVDKGLDELRELSNLLDYSRTKLTLVGEISQNQIDGFNSSVEFLGSVKNRDVLAQVYSKSDIFLNFTHADNFPTVNIEALYFGLPIMTFGIGGSAEVIDKGTGWVISDVSEAAALISDFTPNERIREACRERGSLYTPQRCGKAYVKLYREILSLK